MFGTARTIGNENMSGDTLEEPKSRERSDREYVIRNNSLRGDLGRNNFPRVWDPSKKIFFRMETASCRNRFREKWFQYPFVSIDLFT